MKMLAAVLLALGVVALAVLFLGPREPVDRDVAFDPETLGADLDAWLAAREARVPDLRAGVHKRIHWAGAPGERTPLSIVYLHGFSASSEEIRPVPDKVADALGANLFYTRLSGHGREGAAMAEPVVGDWIEDMAEALAIGRRLGDRVVVIATSTGATLATIAATDPALSESIAGMALVSPNFGLMNRAARLLSLPWARHWVPLLAGADRGFEIQNADHAAFWTSRYPTVATVPLMALVDHVGRLDLSAITVPALFLYSEQDQVVSPDATSKAIEAWGGPTRRGLRVMGPGDDPGSHVIAGDILSPGQTDETARMIVEWAAGL